MKKSFRMLWMLAAFLLPLLSQAQSFRYSCTFEDDSDSSGWTFINGTQTNHWIIGNSTACDGNKSLYITNTTSGANTYTTSSISITYAYQTFELEAGNYYLSFDWKCQGESSYDYLRVFLAPAGQTLTAGVLPDNTTSSYSFVGTTPSGWLSLDGGRGLNLNSSWQHQFAEFQVPADSNYRLIFLWANDGSAGTTPPAAVDNIVFAHNDCPHPVFSHAEDLTSTSINIFWSDNADGDAYEWIVELDSAGQSYGQGIQSITSDTMASLFNLIPNTPYTVYISSHCTNGDTSMYVVYHFTTLCDNITTLPYIQDFESCSTGSSASIACWYRPYEFSTPYVNSSTYAHNSTKGLYWTNTGDGSEPYVVLPGIDVALLSADTLQLSFWARSSSSSYSPVIVVGMMTDPVNPATFTPLTTVRPATTDWTPFEVRLPQSDSLGNYVALKAGNINDYWYAYLDDFTINNAPRCNYVYQADVSNVSGTSALCNWLLHGVSDDPDYYVVTLTNSDDPNAATLVDTTSRTYYLFQHLNQLTNYSVNVVGICQGDTTDGASASFTTRCAVGGASEPSGTAVTQTSGVPVNSAYGNTFCQSIYTAAELSAMGVTPGPIVGITYTWASAGSYNKDLVLFMGHTTSANYTSFIPLTGSMTQVYSGTRTTADVGTVEYHFDTPFVWDGVSNIVLSSFVNQPSGVQHVSSGFNAYSTTGTVTRTIYAYADNAAYTVTNMSTSGYRYTSSARPNVSFIRPCDTAATCAAPNIIVMDVTVDSVALLWAAGMNETSWDLSYKASTDADWTAAATVTDNQYVFDNLLPNTEYVFRVHPDCGGDSIYGMVSVTTPCTPLTTLPFNENFENFTAASTAGSPITTCWYRGTNYTSSSYPYVSSSYSYSGTKSMYFYQPGSSYYTYLALPAVDANVSDLQISFAAYKSSASYTLSVGVMTDPNDWSTYTDIATITPNQVSTWEMIEVPLSSYTGNGHYIALAAYGSSYTYMYVDDIEVSYLPSCPRPTGVTFSNITTNTADVVWTDTAATFFEIEYGPVGFTRGSGTTVTSTTRAVTLYGLNHSSRYEVYVRALCNSGDTSAWSFVTYFTTQCDIINQLPYVQNFAGWGVGSTARPACWSCGGYSSYPYIVSVNDAAGQQVGQALYLYCYGSNQVYASLPELDSISYPVNTVQTVFRAWTNNSSSTSYSHSLIVGLCAEQGNMSTFTPIDSITLTPNPALYEVAFDTALGYGKYITFVSAVTLPNAYYNYAYIDSVAIELLPPCRRPNHLAASNIQPTSADISWSDFNGAGQWQVEYGPYGFMHGSGTLVTVSTNPFTLTGLTPSTSYQFYVRSACSADTLSAWSGVPGVFSTLQNPATVPYFYDFEDDAEWSNWQTLTNSTVNWYRDTAAGNGTNGYSAGRFSMYISADSGRSVSTFTDATVNAAAYRDIDFGNLDSSFMLSFRASAGGYHSGSSVYDGLAIFMVDPDAVATVSESPLESPWGSVNALSLLATVYIAQGWNTYSVYLDTLTGIHRLVFYWFNQNTTYMGTFTGLPATVDDVSIQYVNCPRPLDVHASRVSMSSADVTWYGDENADYRVTLRYNGGVVSSELVHTNHVTFTNLNSGSEYNVFVRKVCSETDSSQLVSGNFITLLCNNGRMDSIIDPTSTTTSDQMPYAATSRYSYMQTIVPSSELNGAGELSGIYFYYANTAPNTGVSNCTISIGHTNMSSFDHDSAWVNPVDMQIVYTGSLICSPGWNHFEFGEPFVYDGAHNVVIAVDNNSGVLNSSNSTFYVNPSTSFTTIVASSSTDNPNGSTLDNLLNFDGTPTRYAMTPQMMFDVCPLNSCPRPILRDPIVRADGVTLRWRNTGTAYQIGYRYATTTSWVSNFVTVEDTFYVINNVLPMTDYVYHVRQYCDTTGISNWSTGSFNSNDIPCLTPMGLHVTSVNNKKVTLYWNPEDNNISYRLHVFNSAFDKTVTCHLAHGSVSGLHAATTYYAAVQATCQDMDGPSQWSDTISFTTDVCPDVSNLTVSDVQGNSVVLDWVEGGRADSWEIQYGWMGFVQGTGTSIVVTSHPYTLTGLVGETGYDFYVRAICDDDFYSEHWSDRVSATTAYSSISGIIDDARVSLYPNPTSSDVVLTLPAGSGVVKVDVMDVAGRVVQHYDLPAGTTRTTLSAATLAQGAYYIRIAGGDLNTVKKLLVK